MRVREGGSYTIKDGERVRVVDPPKPGAGPVEPEQKPAPEAAIEQKPRTSPRGAAKE